MVASVSTRISCLAGEIGSEVERLRTTAALRTSGMCAIALLDGPTNGRRFRGYVTESLIPVLQPGDIVAMDNLPAHITSCVEP